LAWSRRSVVVHSTTPARACLLSHFEAMLRSSAEAAEMDCSLAADPANFAEGLVAAAVGYLYASVANLAEHLG
jgi:hypothetical protein